MCDEKTLSDQDDFTARGGLTRREFGVFSVGAGMAMVWPEHANAIDERAAAKLVDGNVQVSTPDGEADCYFVHPQEGKHPGVILWPDAFGMRDAMKQIGQRLASSGYAVLVVNPYYRNVAGPLFEGNPDFADPATRTKIMSMMETLTAETHTIDGKACVDFLDQHEAVDAKRRIGTMGYCMGGAMTVRTAAARPDRVGAGASFHGGRLVTEGSDSPHLLVPKLEAEFLFAIAENDDESQPEAKTVLRDAFSKAGRKAEIEVYEGALHGWCPPDSQVYNEAQAERAWARLLVVFGHGLKGQA